MSWDLPESVEVQRVTYPIRTDYRCILDILTDLSDPEEDGRGRAIALLIGLYPDFEDMPEEHYEDAIQAGLRFINGGGQKSPHKAPRLVEWSKDFPLIVNPINRVLGKEVRAVEYMHWWTFLAAFYEIGGDCTFAQVARVRDHLARGKPLDKQDREWYRNNRHLVDFERKYTSAEDDMAKSWGF